MDLSTLDIDIPPGFRFCPEDEELIRHYLHPKIRNTFFNGHDLVRDCEIFGVHAREPWQIWESFPKRDGEDLFFFTTLAKMSDKGGGKNFVREIGGGTGKWHQQGKKENPIIVSVDADCQITAIKKSFSYRNDKSDQNGNWLLFEYCIPALSEVSVLCQLRKKDEKHTTDGETEPSTTSQMIRVDEDTLEQNVSFTDEVVQDFNSDSNIKKRKRDTNDIDHDATNEMYQKTSVDHEGNMYMQLNTVSDNGLQLQDMECYFLNLKHNIVNDSNVIAPTESRSHDAEQSQPPIVVAGVNNNGDAAGTAGETVDSEAFFLGLEDITDLSGFSEINTISNLFSRHIDFLLSPSIEAVPEDFFSTF